MNSTNGSKLPYPLRGATRITINAHEFFHELFFSVPIFRIFELFGIKINDKFAIIHGNSCSQAQRLFSSNSRYINVFIFCFATLRLRAFFLVKSYGKPYVCCNPYCDSVKNVSFTIIVYFFSKNIWLN